MEKIFVAKDLKIKWVGLFDFAELYKVIKEFLEDKKMFNEKTLEKKYVEKSKPGGKQLEILWHAEVPRSDFFKYNIDISFLILGMTDVEVPYNNKKRKLNKADIEIRITSWLDVGGGKWEKQGFLQKMYQNFLIKGRVDNHLRDLYNAAYGLHKLIKDFLTLRSY